MATRLPEHPVSRAPARRGALLLLAALLAVFFGLGVYSEAMLYPAIDDSDEPGYFDETAWIAEHGGALGFLGQCVKGTVPFEYRHPLIQWLAAPWARRTLEAVRPMRAAKVGVSVLCVVALYLLCRQMAPAHLALAFTALVALSRNWYMKSRVLCVEPVVYLLFFLAWVLIAGLWRPRGRWLWAGAATGLTFLAKGTAVLLLLAIPAAVVIHLATRRRAVPPPPPSATRAPSFGVHAALFVLGFALLASPLLVRNAVRYGNPLYNRNSELIWADQYSAHLMTDEQRAQAPLTLSDYVQGHSLGDIVERLAVGAVKQAPRLLGSLAPDAGFGRVVWVLTLLLSSLLVALGLWAAVERVRTWGGIYTLCLVGVTFALFAWHHPITYASRFIATLGPVCGFLALSVGPVMVWRRLEPFRRWAFPAAVAVVVLAILLMANRIERYGLVRPAGRVAETEEYRFLYAWYEREVIEAKQVCFQTPYLAPRYAFHWVWAGSGLIHELPPFERFADLQAYMDQKGAQYLVIERDSLLDREALLVDYFGYDDAGALKMAAEPPGWRLWMADPYGETDFVILRRAR